MGAGLTETLKETARRAGADLVGVAPIERFEGTPPEHHPASIFPEARSVVAIGRRILRGSLRGIEEGTNTFDYSCYGYSWLEKVFLPTTVYRAVGCLEDAGWEAVPMYPYPTNLAPEGVPVAPDRPAPNVTIDFDRAAVAAGLGEIGFGGFFLSPQFGPRVRFGMILTDAELEEDPLFAGSICGECMKCVDDCPLGAMTADRTTTVNVAGKSSECAVVDYSLCRTCRNGAQPSTFHDEGNPDRLAAVCARSCVHQLEANGKISNTFATPFRTRRPWSVSRSGEITMGEAAPRIGGCSEPHRA